MFLFLAYAILIISIIQYVFTLLVWVITKLTLFIIERRSR